MLVEPDPKLYFFVSQGMITIDNLDDAEEMRLTDEAFGILNFKEVKCHYVSFVHIDQIIFQ